MKAIGRMGVARGGGPREAAVRLALIVSAAVVCIAAYAALPGAQPGEYMPDMPTVAAAGHPNVMWLSERETPALASIKALAAVGTPAGGGPSANQGQTILLKGAALNVGVASFTGYNGPDVTSPLTSVKPLKKGKAVVPPQAITGDVTVIPDGGEETSGLRLQIVPTISSLSTALVTAGGDLTINGTGFDPATRIVFPGVPDPVTPAVLDNDSAMVVVPQGVQKGKLKVTTPGGTSNTVKIKLATTSLANHALATNPLTGEILATDDNDNILAAYDPATGTITRVLPVVNEPTRVLVMNTSEARVVNDAGEVTFINLATWEASGSPFQRESASVSPSSEIDVDRGVLRTTPGSRFGSFELSLGMGAEASAETASGKTVVVFGDRGMILVVDLANRAIVSSYRFDGPVEGVTIGLDGRAYTIDRRTGTLLSVPVD